jgi:hypothetical protein
MAKNKIVDLRDHLFETIEMLKDDEQKDFMTIERAKAISNVAQVIVNTAKLEIDFMRAADRMDGLVPNTGFMSVEKKQLESKTE